MGKVAANAGAQKMIGADVVSLLLMAIGNTSISKQQYYMMSAVDKNRTTSSFEHQFRSITTKAKELKVRQLAGEEFKAVVPAKKRAEITASPATPRKRKTASSEDDLEITPSKKATPKTRIIKKTENSTADFGGEGFPQDAAELIEGEKEREDGFV
ncbi:hypothetical protein EJ02DRAFT_406947 [Clathrospora elynae]|uniref:Uncharacterized protein n=1 Tax=Clathrospora elynae TaxID=706981 RepID=A0A6A5SLF6_9PLEO|nr:hypothetical protein EJ02DRAFT_406947 [Clathrospora elynae]